MTQVLSVFDISGCDFEKTLDCLLEGPTGESILSLANERYSQYTVVKVTIDENDAWPDFVAHYKSNQLFNLQLRVVYNSQPVIDTGGVCRQT